MHKAHYVLMNIEVGNETLTELEHAFKFNDAVLRHLTVSMREAATGPSPMMKEEKSRNVTEGPAAEGKPAVLLGAFLVSFLFIRTSARLIRSPLEPWRTW